MARRFTDNPQPDALTGNEYLPATSVDGGTDTDSNPIAPGDDVGIPLDALAAWVGDQLLDNDTTLAGDSATKAATQHAVKTAIAAAIAALPGSGASIGVQFLADTSATTDADPGAGNLRWNNATQTSATVIYIDDATFDGASLTAIWPRLNAGGVLFLQHATDQDTWQIWEFTAINDASGYSKLTVTLWGASGSFADNDPILMTLDKGQSGGGAVTAVNGATGTPIIRQVIPVACSDETTALTAGAGKVTFINPYSTVFNVLAVVISLTTAQASGSIFTVDINEASTSILSTKLTIDNTEKTSSTAATAAVISDASIAAYAEMTIDIDQVGDGTAKGLKAYIIGYPTP